MDWYENVCARIEAEGEAELRNGLLIILCLTPVVWLLLGWVIR